MKITEKVIDVISKINHPAINYSLTKLGIVKDIELVEDTVILTFAFPFPDIPIVDKLIYTVSESVGAMGFKLEYIVRVMKEEEKKMFLQLEKEAWKGL